MTRTGRDRVKKKVVQNKITERILQELRVNLLQEGYLSVDLVPYLLKWADIQLKQDLSFEEIANALNDLKIPTLSGRGTWRGDTIEYLFNY